MPAETCFDDAARQTFDNREVYVALFGEDRTIQELSVPRITSAQGRPASIKAKLPGKRAA